MKKIILIIIALFSFLILSAQEAPEEIDAEEEIEEINYFKSDAFGGNVIITQSEEIEKLIGTRLAILKKQKGFEGYRIRIYAGVGSGAREEANKIRTDFMEKFDDISVYLTYNNPNWEVHAGNYHSRFEAMQDMEKLRKEYAEAFIVKTIVKFPELSRSKDENN